MSRIVLIVGLLTALTLDQSAAQQPTEQQRDAIRAACRSDFMAHCAGVQPGGRDALECLIRNDEKLSPSCRSAVAAVTPKPEAPAAAAPAPAEPAAPAPAAASGPAETPAKTEAAAPSQDQTAAVRGACTMNDLMAHCSWIAPNNPEILQCLKANAADLSAPCKSALEQVPVATPAAVETQAPAEAKPVASAPPSRKPAEPARASEPAAAAAPAAPAVRAAAAPTEQQKSAIRAACRSDFMARCGGVQPGGAAALQCLQRNEAKLSGSCRTAVAAIAGGEGASPGAPAGASTAAAAAPAAVAPIGEVPPMRPRQALMILQVCGPDARALCAGIPPGGGRLLNCLAEKASSLSPGCYSVLSAAAH
jgi:hypothetical protein